MFKVQPYFVSFISLLFPDLCIVCNEHQKARGALFCLPCLCELPYTNFTDWRSNEFCSHFEGRVRLEKANSVFYLTQGGSIEKLIHKLKYHNQPKLAIALGKFSGKILMQNGFLESVDYIVPVPLHPRKLRKRGYNQSEKLGFGISRTAQIEMDLEVLFRNKNTKSQTKMNRFDRLKNTENAFDVHKEDKFIGKHILLLDDVLTTGSTLESCAKALENINGIRISMLSLAIGIN